MKLNAELIINPKQTVTDSAVSPRDTTPDHPLYCVYSVFSLLTGTLLKFLRPYHKESLPKAAHYQAINGQALKYRAACAIPQKISFAVSHWSHFLTQGSISARDFKK